jgi:hypothetical protein
MISLCWVIFNISRTSDVLKASIRRASCKAILDSSRQASSDMHLIVLKKTAPVTEITDCVVVSETA